ncbi:sensor histidine kinase [Flavivirga eckloniae]|uniref:histidine kinase n=1 Tax=Flavivirga eckloniae TaxID=1803846 RepID=A0A2K9PLD2_9FLAO|nr:ATP-binding protein [Flavivirga eckloniae]AUP77648.1 two-component sensor histidine kinase [Flavivirga eckloniae]
MNTLLKRQIRKYLKEDLVSDSILDDFVEAIDKSYNNFDEQFIMLQRSMAISSEELYQANRKLQQESEAQQDVINKLKNVIDTLKFYNLEENDTDNGEFDGLKLIEFIDHQTKEIIEMNKQREILMDELAHQNQELSDYAHMVSHDLKSPLRSIDTLTTWLKGDYEDQLDEQGKGNLELIRSNVEKMDALISGILEYSTIGKTQVEIYDVDLNIILKDVRSIITLPEGFVLNICDMPTVKGDKYRLQQLFQNLIDNAIKYNDKEKGRIDIETKEQEDHWEFSIKDNGKGIDEEYHKKIFKTFEKLENNVDSTGIGLSIVKKIIDLFGGKIWVDSEVGKGTTFHFTLKK